MTKQEPPVEIPRPLFSRRAETRSESELLRDDPHFQPRYVQLLALREHGHGRRNLAWGVVTFLLALVLLSFALFFAGSKALLALAACLVTSGALFVLARLHVFRQRNGGFFALGMVCLLGSAIALVELGYGALDTILKNRPLSATAPVAAQATEVQPMLLSAAFALSEPDPKAGTRVKVLKDSRVTIENKPFLIKAGDLFPLGSKSDGEVTLVVRDLLVALPADATEILGESPAMAKTAVGSASVAARNGKGLPGVASPAAVAAAPAPSHGGEATGGPDSPQQITARAQQEVLRRYPALGVKDSLENQMFVSMYREIRDAGGDDFFKNAEWPIELAELLAKREKWVRGAPPITVSSGAGSSIVDDPAAEAPAAPAANEAPADPAPGAEPAPAPQIAPEPAELPQL